MDGERLYSIGDLARRTGLTVKAVRFYSDSGIVPPTDRSPAGYRRYGIEAVARLDLVRTLRELGLDLPTIRTVLDREVSLAEVAAAHADALAVRIRTLRLRRAVLTAVAKRGSTPKEMDLMHRLARLSEGERRSLIDDFLASVFGGLDGRPEFAGISRTMTPELPEDPEPDQVEAWVELAEMVGDPDFRASMRQTAEHYAAERYAAEEHAAPRTRGVPRPDAAAMVRAEAAPAIAAGIDPASPAAGAVVAAVMAGYGADMGRPDDPDLRQHLLARLNTVTDPRRERYLELLAVINGWPPPDPLAPTIAWFIEALTA